MPRQPGIPPHLKRALVAALICALCGVFYGCGSSDETFTNAEAGRALAALDGVQESVDEGRCELARKYVNRLAVQSTHVNDDRPELGDAYASSVARLQTLVTRECVEISAPSPTDEVTASTGTTGGTDVPNPTDETGGGTDNGGNTDNGTPTNPDTGDGGAGTGTDNGTGNGTGGSENSGGAGPGT
ncbi:MAG: hypothetical protein QM648_03595 [Solirubrobacterales bacterium]